MKNCGKQMFMVVHTEDFMKTMVGCAKHRIKHKNSIPLEALEEGDDSFAERVSEKALRMIQGWAISFQDFPQYPNFQKFYHKLISKGFFFTF